MKELKIENGKVRKSVFIETDKLHAQELENKLTGKIRKDDKYEEFVISYRFNQLYSETLASSECTLSLKGNTLTFNANKSTLLWRIDVTYSFDENVIRKTMQIRCENDILLDWVDMGGESVQEGLFQWSAPIPEKRVHIPAYITATGQPVYYDEFFYGLEFPTADNRIKEDRVSAKYYIGKKLSDFDGCFQTHGFIVGASSGSEMRDYRKSFLEYVYTFARPFRFRVQFNSWYDHMLDIDEEKIETSFKQVAQGLKSVGYRDLDCYVVDDGWVDYKKSEFWAFNKKFPQQFERASELTKELNSTFGVWFGPRGGYTKAMSYARRLKKIGYKVNRKSHDICTAQPRYIHDLGEKMAEFMQKYNVTYFKIDGFAIEPCPSKKHGHIVGGENSLYFYTEYWENWAKTFERLREINESVFLNITSYSHCSPWFLKWADSVWLNNSADMYYEGKGSNLNMCLNYRDGRYYDLQEVRQVQFPNAYYYNHEPCYGERNYNPPLPSMQHKTVIYTDEEYRAYLYACMMRGTGFVELYLSPSMMDGGKWKITAQVLSWAEENFDAISKATYFGGIPKNGDVYGYWALNGGKGFILARNPSEEQKTYTLSLENDTNGSEQAEAVYGSLLGVQWKDKQITFTLQPFEMVIVELK